MNNFYVYAYLREHNSKNGCSGSMYYVGKGKKDRAFSLKRTVNLPTKKENIIFLSENMSEVDAFQAEIFLIYLHGRLDVGTGCLHNHTAGGEGRTNTIVSTVTRQKLAEKSAGRICSEATRQKISTSEKGKTISEETRKKISKNNLGRKMSMETKRKMSLAAKGKPKTIEHNKKVSEAIKNLPRKRCIHCNKNFPPASYAKYHGENCIHHFDFVEAENNKIKRKTGRPVIHTIETRQKISDMHKGKHLSEATEFKKGHRHSTGTIEKISDSRKGQIPWNKGKNIEQ